MTTSTFWGAAAISIRDRVVVLLPDVRAEELEGVDAGGSDAGVHRRLLRGDVRLAGHDLRLDATLRSGRLRDVLGRQSLDLSDRHTGSDAGNHDHRLFDCLLRDRARHCGLARSVPRAARTATSDRRSVCRRPAAAVHRVFPTENRQRSMENASRACRAIVGSARPVAIRSGWHHRPNE